MFQSAALQAFGWDTVAKGAWGVFEGFLGNVLSEWVTSNPPTKRVLDSRLVVVHFRHDFTKSRYAPYNCTEQSYSDYYRSPMNAETYQRRAKTCGGSWGEILTTPFDFVPGDYRRVCETEVDKEVIAGYTIFRYEQSVSQVGASKVSTLVQPSVRFQICSLSTDPCVFVPPNPATAYWVTKSLSRITPQSTTMEFTSGYSDVAYYGIGIQSVNGIGPWVNPQ